MTYYLLNAKYPILFRTDASGLAAKTYQIWDFKFHEWTDTMFPNMLSDDFDRGSWGFEEITEEKANQIIA